MMNLCLRIKTIYGNKVSFCLSMTNKAVYTTAPVAGSWAGAVMIWAGAVMIWAGACSNTNFPTLKMPKNAKKAKCDGPTDRPTDTVTYRSRARDKNKHAFTSRNDKNFFRSFSFATFSRFDSPFISSGRSNTGSWR